MIDEAQNSISTNKNAEQLDNICTTLRCLNVTLATAHSVQQGGSGRVAMNLDEVPR